MSPESLDPYTNPAQRLLETVRRELRELTGSATPPSEALTGHFLLQDRVLVVLGQVNRGGLTIP
jgi:hypothetical protein